MNSPRVVLVGGGGRGIGAATARRLSAAGDIVEVVDAFETFDDHYALADGRDRELLEQEGGIRCHAVDLRETAATAAVVDEVVARHGRLDVAVTCAGAIEGGLALWETDAAAAERMWQSNTVTAWNLARASTPHLLTRPPEARPTFVAVTSVAASHGLFGLSAYTVSKHATTGLVRALAADLAGTTVTACAVSPAATDTAMLRCTAGLYGLDDPGALAEHQHGHRPLAPHEVAAVVEFATAAGTAVHGAILPADGGFGRV